MEGGVEFWVQAEDELFAEEVGTVHGRDWVDLEEELHSHNEQHIRFIDHQESRLQQLLLPVHLRIVVRGQFVNSRLQRIRKKHFIHRLPPVKVEQFQISRLPEHLEALEQVAYPVAVFSGHGTD